MSIKNRFYICLCSLMLATNAPADPSKPIRSAMSTPASIFDLFILQLWEQSKCFQGWFGNSADRNKELCMTTIDYDFDDNIVEMNFLISETDTKIKGFKTANEKRKEQILTAALKELAISIGVESIDEKIGRFGMIQFTPMRRDWKTDDFDADTVKDEIADRTVIHLRVKNEGFIYKASRDHRGKINLSKETLKH